MKPNQPLLVTLLFFSVSNVWAAGTMVKPSMKHPAPVRESYAEIRQLFQVQTQSAMLLSNPDLPLSKKIALQQLNQQIRQRDFSNRTAVNQEEEHFMNPFRIGFIGFLLSCFWVGWYRNRHSAISLIPARYR